MVRRRTIPPSTRVLAWATLHYLSTGAILDQADGERLYGTAFDWLAVCDEAHPRICGAVWRQHRSEIEAHARTLGRARPWIADHLDGTT